ALRQIVGWILVIVCFSGAIICSSFRGVSRWLLLCALGFAFFTAVETFPVFIIPFLERHAGQPFGPSEVVIIAFVLDLFRLLGVGMVLAGITGTMLGLKRRLEAAQENERPEPVVFVPPREASEPWRSRQEGSHDVRP